MATQDKVRNYTKMNRKEYLKQYRLDHRDKHREYMREWIKNNRDRTKIYNYNTGIKRVLFKDKRVILKENPRSGVCSLCEKEGRTHIHHIEYHPEYPLKDTIELCGSCHRKQHRKVEN